MDSRRVVAVASRLREALSDADPSLALLRGDLTPVAVAILAERLGGLTRTMPVVEFVDQVAADLDELRGLGFVLVRTAQEYFAEWVRQRAVMRRPGEGREETVELTPQAHDAIMYALSLGDRRSRVTASRLANVSELLARLARDTDPRPEERLQALLAERDRLDEQIRQAEAGEYEPIDDATSMERLDEILRLATEIPGDFARVSADFDGLNHDLREKIIQEEGSRGAVLEQVFEGMDLIEQSDEGRTFDAFYDMVLDPERSAVIDDAINQVLARGFATSVDDRRRQFLRGFLTTLQRESNQVRSAMTGFDRSLHHFVASRAYQEQAQMRQALGEAQALALKVAGSGQSLIAKVGYALPATAMAATAVSAWRLYNPGDVRTVEPVRPVTMGTVDMEELRRTMRLSEIDFKELRSAVFDSVAVGPATIGDVLRAHPATQGLASVVGLMVLADEVGMRTAGVERLMWVSTSGVSRSVDVRRHLFTTVPAQWGHDDAESAARSRRKKNTVKEVT